MTNLTAPVASPLLRLVTEVLGDFTNKEMLFTAYDVTKECRTRVNLNGNKFYVDHATVRDMVDEFYSKEIPPFQNGSDYIREDHAFFSSGRGVQARIYRPIGADVSSYLPDDVSVNVRGAAFIPSKSTAPFVAVGPAVAMVGVKHNHSKPNPSPGNAIVVTAPVKPVAGGTVNKTSRGRLIIPKALVEKLGLKHGDRVGIYTNHAHGAVYVTTRALNVFDDSFEATVDKDCNIRVGGAALAHINKTQLTLTVDTAQSQITIG